LNVLITGANTHDSRMLAPLLDTNPGCPGTGWSPGAATAAPEEAACRQGALRHDRSRDTVEALLSPASALICARPLLAAS
jgi:hypothetical protein